MNKILTIKKLNAATCLDSAGNDRTWDAADNACYVCKNGGIWNAAPESVCVSGDS